MDLVEALFFALIKAYDSYITPLSYPHVRCWKCRVNQEVFLLGMSKQRIPFNANDTIEMQHLSHYMPMELWDKTNVMTVLQPPSSENLSSAIIIDRLLKL